MNIIPRRRANIARRDVNRFLIKISGVRAATKTNLVCNLIINNSRGGLNIVQKQRRRTGSALWSSFHADVSVRPEVGSDSQGWGNSKWHARNFFAWAKVGVGETGIHRKTRGMPNSITWLAAKIRRPAVAGGARIKFAFRTTATYRTTVGTQFSLHGAGHGWDRISFLQLLVKQNHNTDQYGDEYDKKYF